MGLKSKILGAGKAIKDSAMKVAGNPKVKAAFLSENTVENGGGLSSLLVPKKAGPAAIAGITAGMWAISGVDTGVKLYNKGKMGQVSYSGRMDKMTKNFTSGAVEGMARAANGNPETLTELVNDTMNGGPSETRKFSRIETYGVTPEFVSALYGMR